MLEEIARRRTSLEGTVVKGSVVAIENDFVADRCRPEVRRPRRPQGIRRPGGKPRSRSATRSRSISSAWRTRTAKPCCSREKARREEAWTLLEKAFKANERVTGVIFGRVKGGFTVDLSGAVAFLPGSQVDIRPVRDIGPLMGTPQPFQILKMDRSRGNIVVSRRAVLEESRAEARSELVAYLKEGQVLDGVVKNITDYGAFVDLGGVDGLLHVTDIAWRRINHPSEALHDRPDTSRCRSSASTRRPSASSLGMKQLEADPWEGVDAKYPVGAKFKGRVTNITDYGAFVELEPGIEGLVHVSEMSWTKKNVHPGKIVSTSQEVEVMVLDVDPQKRRISLGLKQCLDNPWEAFVEQASGRAPSSKARSRTSPSSACSSACPARSTAWSISPTSTGTSRAKRPSPTSRRAIMVKVKVLDVDVEKERISLGIKQLAVRSVRECAGQLKKGDVVTCTVTAITDGGIEVDARRRRRPASSASPTCRATAASSVRTVSPSAKRSTPRSPAIDRADAPDRAVDQGQGGRGGEAGDGRVRLVGLRRQPRRHPRRGPPPRPEQGAERGLIPSSPTSGLGLKGAAASNRGGPFHVHPLRFRFDIFADVLDMGEVAGPRPGSVLRSRRRSRPAADGHHQHGPDRLDRLRDIPASLPGKGFDPMQDHGAVEAALAGHALPVASHHVVASVLARDRLRQVPGDVLPCRRAHEIVEWGQREPPGP